MKTFLLITLITIFLIVLINVDKAFVEAISIAKAREKANNKHK